MNSCSTHWRAVKVISSSTSGERGKRGEREEREIIVKLIKNSCIKTGKYYVELCSFV